MAPPQTRTPHPNVAALRDHDLILNHTKQRFPRSIFFLASLWLLLTATPASAQPSAHGTEVAGGAWKMPEPRVPTPSADPAARGQPAYGADGHYQGYGNAPSYAGYYRVPEPGPPAPAMGEQAADAAEIEDPLAPPNFDLALGTLFPLALGPEVTLELPGRLLLQANVGWMPPAYGSVINGVVQGFGGYEARYQPLVEGALEDALVVRATGGWRPFSSAGFEMFGGYTLIELSGATDPSAVAEVAEGPEAAAVVEAVAGDEVEIDSTLHNFHVGLGWRWVAFEHLVIRANAAYTQTLSSATTVATPDNPEVGEQVTPQVDEQLGDVYQTYVKLPVLGLSAGYRF